MANIKSAKKRILVTETKTARNKAIRSEVKTSIKKVEAAVAAKDKAAAEAANITPDMSVDEIGTAMEEQMKTLKFDGITGSGMTWDEKGDVDKEPKAVVIKDGAYVSAE